MKINDYIEFFQKYLTGTLNAAVELLFRPKSFFTDRVAFYSQQENRALQDAVIISVVFIFVGASVAEFFGIGGDKSFLDVRHYIGAVFVWIIFSVFCHILMKIIRGKAPFKLTLIVALLAISVAHVVWVPVFGFVAKNSAHTRVTVTYDYLISFGYGNWKDVYLSPMFGQNARNFETFIKELSPEKVGTALVPASQASGVRSEAEWIRENPNRPFFSTERVPISDEIEGSLEVTEATVLNHDSLLARSATYLLPAYFIFLYFYLARGLAVAHSRPMYVVFPYLILSLVALSAIFLAALILGVL